MMEITPKVAITAAISLTAIIGAVTGFRASIEDLDQMVVSHAELDQKVDPVSVEVAGLSAFAMCDRLERKLDTLRDRLWRAEQTNASPESIRDLKGDINKIVGTFNANSCSKVLAG